MSFRAWTKQMRTLLWTGFLFTLAYALSAAFINVYLWNQTKSFIPLAVFNGLQFAMMPVIFFLASRLWRVAIGTFLRTGIFLHGVFYGLILLLDNRLPVSVMGILLGMGAGFYWYAYNLLALRVTERHLRGKFQSGVGTSNSIALVTAPLLSGFIIMMAKEVGYTLVFGLSLLFFGLSFWTSLRLQKTNEQDRPMRLFRRRHPNWNRVLTGNFFQGLREGVFVFILSIMVIIVTGSAWVLGKYVALTAGLSAVSYFLVGRMLSWNRYNEFMLIGSLASSIALVLFLFEPNYWILLVYGVISALFAPFFLVPFGTRVFQVIDEAHERFEREYMVEREIVINSGRVLSIAVFAITYHYLPENTLPLYLLIAGSMQILAVLCLRRVGFRLNGMWEDA
ncbi:MFS transporter [Effusibacillus dendaii]|uniref:MFS transporter n=1 Tax=Effusibacillus dendaii TaxID=2743772 RepID=A0A7I8DD56_9BACL|nr:hypothetical protein [Effusibacillus dendaii]BCJ88044.1 hypothetical protein skT53_30290 [Effusibacillus dendaii]